MQVIETNGKDFIYVEFLDEGDDFVTITLSYHDNRVWFEVSSYGYDYLRGDIILKLGQLASNLEAKLNCGTPINKLVGERV